MEPGYVPLWAENRNECFRINPPRFPPRLHREERRGVGVLSEAVLIIRVDAVSLPTKRADKGEPYTAGGQIKQIRRVNVQVQRGEFRRKQVCGLQPHKVNQRKVARKCDMLAIDHRIKWNRLSA